MKFQSTIQVITSAFFASLLAGCGGGGGGDSSGGGGGGGPVAQVCNSWEAGAYTQQFNEYMPISEGATINYSDNFGDVTSSSFTFNEEESTPGTDVYGVSFTRVSDDQNVTLQLTSDADEIVLFGIDGPFVIEISGINVSLNNLRFENPIILYDGNALITGTTDASIDILGVTTPGVSISYVINLSESTINIDSDTLPTINLVVGLSITTPEINLVFAVIPSFTAPLEGNIDLAKGIGIVQNSFELEDTEVVSGKLASLLDLPLPIWFDDNAPNAPTLAAGSESIFQTLDTAIRADEYTISNQSVLDTLDWISVTETSSCTYEVELTNSSDLPTDLTSLEIVFEDSNGDRLSGSVTLQ